MYNKVGQGSCNRGVVTWVNLSNNVEVNNVPRQVLDVRPVVMPEDDTVLEEVEHFGGRAPSVRNRRRSAWMDGYVME